MDMLIPFMVGLVVASAWGFVSSLDALNRWGWHWLFGSVAILWPILAVVTAAMIYMEGV